MRSSASAKLVHRSTLSLSRQLSGAMIRISNCEDRDAPANLDRTISITGNNESVALAQYLINMRCVPARLCRAPTPVLPLFLGQLCSIFSLSLDVFTLDGYHMSGGNSIYMLA